MARLDELGWDKARVWRESGCPKSLITELLNGKRNGTTYLPEIHKALGWDPPQPPLAAEDVGEVTYFWERIDEAGRRRVIERAREEMDRVLNLAKDRKRK